MLGENFMNLKKSLYLIALGALPMTSFAQAEAVPLNWYNLDYNTDGVMGISTEKAYKTLLKGKNQHPLLSVY
ncbi:hypothetical protein KUH03_14525 [Sphingobacterium sp. E70]|uniref:hypothetical protein n=1 Tax=Sphingobacterium sp. E70 TaxID=2853439 RepID=UPI002795D918|nr:hypothetical protein [Sphingobacterium sp. E70]ULT27762.1 hypothetical protein KUH03_14525 [Sphingobacterium sp. E70]